MLEVGQAQPQDFDAILALESSLFLEDAGRHDPFSDTTWPSREGRQDLEQLVASSDALVLVAKLSAEPVGMLMAYISAPSPTRQPVDYAVLRSLYVAKNARRTGAASMLIEQFLQWARDRGCVQAQVDHYAANGGAAALYERIGFVPRTTLRVYPL